MNVFVQCENYRESILLDANWEKAHFAFGRYLDQLYTDAKQREVCSCCLQAHITPPFCSLGSARPYSSAGLHA